jgi:hypothetical protein
VVIALAVVVVLLAGVFGRWAGRQAGPVLNRWEYSSVERNTHRPRPPALPSQLPPLPPAQR